MEVAIRRAERADLDEILSIHQELKRPSRDRYSLTDFLVAEANGAVIGCAGSELHEDGAYFYGLAVRRKWQRQGVGGMLMQARLDALERTGAEYAVALAMFWNSRFFRKFLFAPVKRQEIPLSAQVIPELVDPRFRRSAVMLRRMS